MAQNASTTARPRRRWLQFKLRTLLVLMLSACIPLAWLTMKRERTRRQRRAVVAIDNAGGNVWYVGKPRTGGRWGRSSNIIPYDSQQLSENPLDRLVEEATAGDVVAVDFALRGIFYRPPSSAKHRISVDGQDIESNASGEWILHRRLDRDGMEVPRGAPTHLVWREFELLPALELLNLGDRSTGDADLREIAKLTQLRCLLIGNACDVTDAGLECLSALKKLRVLSLSGSKITDDGLRHLATLTRLEVLELDHAPIRGSGLAHLRSLRNLKLLSLRFTPLRDDGLVHLSSLTSLERLYFFETPLTDAGLEHLKPLTGLEILHLGKTGVTFAGADAFERDLPRRPIIR